MGPPSTAPGRLIGVPTQGTELDCRPGDTNLDGTIDAEDVGCIPIGGSIGSCARSPWHSRSLPTQDSQPGTIETESAGRGSCDRLRCYPRPPSIRAPTDPSAATSYVFAEDYCRTGPVYPPGTRIVLPRE